MHGLNSDAMLVALARPGRIQVQTLLVVAVPFLDVSGETMFSVGAHAGDRDNHAIKVRATAVISAGSSGSLASLDSDLDLWAARRKFFFCHGNTIPRPPIGRLLVVIGGEGGISVS